MPSLVSEASPVRRGSDGLFLPALLVFLLPSLDNNFTSRHSQQAKPGKFLLILPEKLSDMLYGRDIWDLTVQRGGYLSYKILKVVVQIWTPSSLDNITVISLDFKIITGSVFSYDERLRVPL